MIQREIDKLFEAQGTSCPFELARQLKVKINYVDFPAPIYGYYKSVLYSEPILINSKLSLEQQEKVCEYLMVRHLLYNGIEYCLDQETFERIEKEAISAKPIQLQQIFASI